MERLETEPPSYWTPDLHHLIQRRASMPGKGYSGTTEGEICVDVQRWQSTYVRYHGQHEGQVTQNGWELASSQAGAHREETMGVTSLPVATAGGLPLSIQMRITAAPAEFAVPVKQDRSHLCEGICVRTHV